MPNLISLKLIASRIFEIRGKRVMLDKDLAELYEVETRQLTRQVRRNIERFPEDFMFQLTKEEFKNLMCHFGTSNRGGTRKLPYVFTEQGVAMLSGVLRSKRAIRVNIQIMRAFVQLRRMLISYKDIRHKVEEMEKKYDEQFAIVFEAIRQLLEPPKQTEAIGFKVEN
jgi:hypothetical protein